MELNHNEHFYDNEYRPKIRFWLPEGAIDESCLRKDIQDLRNRGFGGIEVVTENFFNRPVDKGVWNDDKWLKTIEVILEESRRLGMTVDLSNGLQWPISSPTISQADHSATLYELTYGVNIIQNVIDDRLKLPTKRSIRGEGTASLISVQAYQVFESKKLIYDSYIDLTSFVEDDNVIYDFSKLTGKWCLFAFWGQPANQKVGNRYYVIDHLSKEGVIENQYYWKESFFRKIPPEKTVCIESLFCDSLEYEVSMEWTRDFLKVFQNRKKYSLLPFLPVIGSDQTYPKNDIPGYTFSEASISEAANNDYLEMLSYLYETRHLGPLTQMAHQFDKKIRYQVAYNKPFNCESAALMVDIPENESLGRPSLDNLRTMAAAIHLTGKKRYSFECSAEFKNAYGQTQGDLFWWIKRSYMAGNNSQVFHGASYSGKLESSSDCYIPNTQWPGYEAFGKMVSNYWNRTLSTSCMKDFIDTLTRINKITQKQHQVELAVLRDDYLNTGKGSDGDHLIKDKGLLNESGFSYEFVSSELLTTFVIENGCVVTNNIGYKALVVQSKEKISTETLKILSKLAYLGLRIYIVGNQKLLPKFMVDILNQEQFSKTMRELLKSKNVFQVEDFSTLLRRLSEEEIIPTVNFYKSAQVLTSHCFDGENDYFLFYQYNKVEYEETKKSFIKTTYQPLLKKKHQKEHFKASILTTGVPRLLDPVSETLLPISYYYQGDRCHIEMELEEDEFAILVFSKKSKFEQRSLLSHEKKSTVLDNWILRLYSLEKDREEALEFCESSYHLVKEFSLKHELSWWQKIDNTLHNFAGYGLYEAEFILTEIADIVYLKFPEISDTFEIFVNGQRIPSISQDNIRVLLTNHIRTGKNYLQIKVYSNLYNKLHSDASKLYGIHGRLVLENLFINNN